MIVFALFLISLLLLLLGKPALLPAYSLSDHYYPSDLAHIDPKIPGYNLPLELTDIANYKDVKTKLKNGNRWFKDIEINEDAEAILKANGFVVRPWFQERDMAGVYKLLKEFEVPIFITSDSLLHLYHIQFDETLMRIEEDHFFSDTLLLSQGLFDHFLEQSHIYTGDLAEAARRNAAFFGVGLALLGSPVSSGLDPALAEKVNEEMDLIQEHEGFADSPLFTYSVDYSQYIPRGHYRRSETLMKYFKAMMWYGSMTFLVKGDPSYCKFMDCPALIPPEEARLKTLQAALIGTALSRVIAEGRSLMEIWERIYEVTAFYVGLADDLTPLEYLSVLKEIFQGGEIDLVSLSQDDALFRDFQSKLFMQRSPDIYGGTGFAIIDPVPADHVIREQVMEEIREKTKGMRFMGQRFVPDSYIFSQLIFPYTGKLTGDPCFTSYEGRRAFPRGLDVMSLLGSERAKTILMAQRDTAYEDYEKQWKKMADLLAPLTPSDWQRNLYWGWLYSLKALLGEYGEGYQTFMKTSAWQDKQLNAALASWTELRHDTILCAKQSYSSSWGFPPDVVGYVEPVPEFYSRLLDLNRMTREGLKVLQVLDTEAENRLVSLEGILERLLLISIKQLENKPLTDEDYDFINDFGEELELTVRGIPYEGLSTVLIADVHTDQNSKKVLEEAVGYAEIILVAYRVPDGRILMGVGPVFSYYEFKQSMANRLTDEEWSEKLDLYDMVRSENLPANWGIKRPSWTYSYALEWEYMEYRSPYIDPDASGFGNPNIVTWELVDERDQAPDLTNLDLPELDITEPDDGDIKQADTSKKAFGYLLYSTFLQNPFLPYTNNLFLNYPSNSLLFSPSQSLSASISRTSKGTGQQLFITDLMGRAQIQTPSTYSLDTYLPWPSSFYANSLSIPNSLEGFSNQFQGQWGLQRAYLPYFFNSYQYSALPSFSWTSNLKALEKYVLSQKNRVLSYP